MASKRIRSAVPSAKLRRRLEQIEACEKSGESLKVYAQRHGLSVDALYQARKEARRQGLIPPYRRPSTGKAGSALTTRPSRFVRAVRRKHAPAALGTTWRLRFSGGEVLECDAPLTADVAHLLLESLGRRS
jgi:hypothetical protein